MHKFIIIYKECRNYLSMDEAKQLTIDIYINLGMKLGKAAHDLIDEYEVLRSVREWDR